MNAADHAGEGKDRKDGPRPGRGLHSYRAVARRKAFH
jgi:hypothetical protein